MKQPLLQPSQRLRIFLGEAQVWQGQPLYRAILELAWQQGIAGATVWRGVEGFGPEHYLSTERLPDTADNLPVIIEMVDLAEKITRLLPHLDAILPQGMLTVSSLSIVRKGDNS